MGFGWYNGLCANKLHQRMWGMLHSSRFVCDILILFLGIILLQKCNILKVVIQTFVCGLDNDSPFIVHGHCKFRSGMSSY